jgi:bifunctional pyridoxal-dependent enzyme with beta-cystathionase and maltose regulon repressor activities
MEKTEEMADAAIMQAEDWIDQVMSYLEEGKTELAAGVMEKLRAVKASLPENIQAEIDKLEEMF